MFRYQVGLNRVCPEHGLKSYLVVLEDDTGGLDVWVGCVNCQGWSRLGERLEAKGKPEPKAAKGRKSMHGPGGEVLSQKAFVEKFGDASDNDPTAKWAGWKHVRIGEILKRRPNLKAAWTLS